MDYPFDSIREEEEEGDQDGDVVRRGPWTPEEDALLVQYISCHGEGRWNLLAKCSGLRRTGKSCRLRWLNYLKPDIKRGNLTPQEQLLILELHSKWGNRWSKIAQHLPGRTDNEIKNYWRTRVQKHAKQLNMECNSQGFIDAIRCFYMPRLVEKIEQQDYSISRSITDFEAASTSSPSIFPVKQMDSTVNNLGSGVDDHMMMNCDGFKDSSSTETVSPSSSSVIMMMSPSSKKVVGSNPTHNIPVMNYGSNYQTSNALMEEGSQERLLLSENGTTAAAASCYYVDSSSSGYDMNLEMVSIAHDDDHLDAFGYNNNHGWGSDNFVNDTWNLDPLW